MMFRVLLDVAEAVQQPLLVVRSFGKRSQGPGRSLD